MRRRFDSVLPLIVLVGFAATALLVNRLLEDAQQQGIDALEDALETEAGAIASSQNQRLASQFAGAGEILFTPGSNIRFDLAVGSPADEETLSTLLGELTQSLEFGYYLVDAGGTVTQGFLLEDEGRIGEPFAWPGFEGVVGTPGFEGGVLPVSTGLTTGGPASAFVFPLGPASPDGTGYFVFENPIEPDSDFSKEIRGLGRGETGEVLFYDGMGTVIAASDPGLIAESVGDDRMREEPEGLHRFDDRVVAIADVPVAGWRVAFRQDADEFERPLAQPVESAGRILVLVLLAAGFLLTVMLYRRLRAARAEQERLRRLSEAQQELISIVSHELRTPVAGVLGFLETTLDHWDGMEEADDRAVSRAATNARRLQAMTRDVLDTQGVESGRLVHVMEPLDLADEVRIAVERGEGAGPRAGVRAERPRRGRLGVRRRRPAATGPGQPPRQRPQESRRPSSPSRWRCTSTTGRPRSR